MSDDEPLVEIPDLLAALRALQELDRKRRGEQEALDELPARVHAATLAVQQAELACDAHKEKTLKLKMSADEAELALATTEARIEKLRQAQNKASSNKEFRTLDGEIAALTESASQTEEAALQCLTAVDTEDEAQPKFEAALEAARERLVQRQAACAEQGAVIQDRLDALAAERSALVSRVPAAVLSQYERILDARGTVVVALDPQGPLCTGCDGTLPLDTNTHVLAGKQLVICPLCGCLLCPPDLPAPSARA